jgi:hypothetical protein
MLRMMLSAAGTVHRPQSGAVRIDIASQNDPDDEVDHPVEQHPAAARLPGQARQHPVAAVEDVGENIRNAASGHSRRARPARPEATAAASSPIAPPPA